MSECPKCHEGGLTWIKTSSGKSWLKRDLGEGQMLLEPARGGFWGVLSEAVAEM